MAGGYFDHNATSPPLPETVEAMSRALAEGLGNPSSLHGPGRRARSLIEGAREDLARLLGAKPQEVVFTSGGTEANQLALTLARGLHPSRRHAVVSAFEHPSILEPLKRLESEGWSITRVAPDSEGVMDAQVLAESVGSDTAFCACLAAHNEVGTLQPISAWAEAVAAAREPQRSPLLHCDGVQALGKTDLRPVVASRLHTLSVSGHKIGGPPGVGALWIRGGLARHPLLRGGPQEMGWRAGTENTLGIVGFGAAIRAWYAQAEAMRSRLRELRDAFEQHLLALLPSARIFGKAADRVPHTSLIEFPGCPSELMLMALDLQGFAVSSGSACSSGSAKLSTSVLVLGHGREAAACTLRFSFGAQNSMEEISVLVVALEKAAKSVKKG